MKRFIGVVGAALAIWSGSAGAQSYVALDLGTLATGSNLAYLNWGAKGVNNSGQVVGTVQLQSNDGPLISGFVTGPNGVGMTYLTPTLSPFSFGNDINASGQVAGTLLGPDVRAIVTGPNGTGLTNLGAPGDYGNAFAINDSGQVTGQRVLPNGETRAFLTGPGGTGLVDISPLPGDAHTGGYDVNAAGQVVGYSINSANAGPIAFVTGPNGTGLTNLGPFLYEGGYSGIRINDNGQVVRSIQVGINVNVALTGQNANGLTDLGTLGGLFGYANGLNNLGQVVGTSATASGERRAFVSSLDGLSLVDLNSLVSLGSTVLVDATGINDLGQIVANTADGRAFLLTPVPEPQALWLLAAGLVVLHLGALRRPVA